MTTAASDPRVRPGRERILDTAASLFYEHGFHAVGVDLIIERAGVAKTTLYRHFASKDDLIVAYLERANEQFWSWFESALPGDASASDELTALFDAVEKLATSRECLGCTFQVTSAEFPDPGHPGHAVALAHKQAVRTRLREVAAKTGAADPDALGDGLLLLMDGAFAAARMFSTKSPATHVAQTARALVDAHAPPRMRRAQREKRVRTA